jgi:FkbM family methyltransferase
MFHQNYKRLIVEIGANNGSDTEKFAADPDAFVISFEPSPILYPICVERFKHRPNVLMLPIAIDVENSVKPFNVSEQGDRGFGSLYDFHHDLLNTVLKKYSEFNTPFSYKQNVLTMRLDSFIMSHNIQKIDFMWIDAQGNDFNVIRSLGDKIDIVMDGRCECTYKIPLYTNEDNYYENVMAYLSERGFQVDIDYVHANDSEIDLHFYRK